MTGITRTQCTAAFAAIVMTGVMAATSVQAGGFAIREQSTSGLGSAFAGNAAGYDLSTIYWNPAGASVATMGGPQTESNYAFIAPETNITGQSTFLANGAPLPGPPFANTTDIGRVALVPASYGAYRLNEKLALGFGLNSPFGLVTKPDDTNWQGQLLGRKSQIFTINANPVLSYNVTPAIAIGVGAQLEYIDVTLKSAAGLGSPLIPPGTPGLGTAESNSVIIGGDDWGLGFTVGVLVNPTSSTKIGLGYRSSIDHKLVGTMVVPGNPLLGVAQKITATLKTPEIITASIRQKVSPAVTLLGTFEWTRWSRLQELNVRLKSAVGPLAAGTTVAQEAFSWEDSWFASGGIEAQVMPRLTLRGGLAYEETPVPDSTRSVRLPDSNRIWASIGATYKWSESISLDFAYSHIFFKKSKINRFIENNPATPADDIQFVGDVESSVDIFAVSLKQKFGATHEPLK